MDPALGLSGGLVVGVLAGVLVGVLAGVLVDGVVAGLLVFPVMSSKVFWELGDVFQFLCGARCPDVFAVALDFCWGASTEVILELNVHVIFDALVCDRCSCCDALLLNGVCVEKVMFAP